MRWREKKRRERGGGGEGQQWPLFVVPAAEYFRNGRPLVGEINVGILMYLFLLLLIIGGGERV